MKVGDLKSMAVEGGHEFLTAAGLFLGAAVIAVPIFKRLGLGSILGYLAAGAMLGPAVFGVIENPASILAISEFGVVLLLFIIGLELEPRRLWSMRRDIFGLGLAQVMLTGPMIAVIVHAFGLNWAASFTTGFALALSSTAFALQLMEEDGTLNTQSGRRAFSILLFQDLAIVPLLAMVEVLSPSTSTGGDWRTIALTLGVVLAFILAGQRLLRPLLRLIAQADNREIFAATALFLVVASALLMNAVGLSMAMGAFLAGVLLAESEYRHQLEADIEPFRGLFLGLFFMSVGMAVDWKMVLGELEFIISIVVGLILFKAVVIWCLVRIFGGTWRQALHNAVTLSQGGEFAFVLFTTAAGLGVMPGPLSQKLIAAVTLSMATTPLFSLGVKKLGNRLTKREDDSDLERPSPDRPTKVIIAGFGRMGQIVAQIMSARGFEVTAIDKDPNRIRMAAEFGNKVYYGDFQRVDVLRAAGATRADLLFIMVGNPQGCLKALGAIRSAFPKLKIIARAFDRFHAIDLMQCEADYVVRETFESAVLMGKEGLRHLGVDESTVRDIEEEFRKRDDARLLAQMGGDGKRQWKKQEDKPLPLIEIDAKMDE